MTQAAGWRTDGVKRVRAASLGRAAPGSAGLVRGSALEFNGTGGRENWIGTVSLDPGLSTGPHHHGRHEVAAYVIRGHGRIRWGERLEHAVEIGPGDFVYFPPHVPHQEINPGPETLDFVVVRSDRESIHVALDIDTSEQPALASG